MITGGAGYIGSHCNRYFFEQGVETIVLDDLSDGHPEAVIVGNFIQGDFGDKDFIQAFLVAVHLSKLQLEQSYLVDYLL